MRTGSAELRGRVRLMSLLEIGQSRLMPLLLAFQGVHPAIAVEVEFAPEVTILDRLRRGQTDFGLVATAAPQEAVRAHALFGEDIILVTRRSNPRDPDRHGANRFVVYRREDALLGQFLRLHRRALPPSCVQLHVIVNSHRSMVDALLAGDLYSVVPRDVVTDHLEKGRLRQVPFRGFQQSIYLVCMEQLLAERRHRALYEYLLKHKTGRRGTS
jgi:DNA-binding transcriptional LysR family regulator